MTWREDPCKTCGGMLSPHLNRVDCGDCPYLPREDDGSDDAMAEAAYEARMELNES
jgi:hypothetical protein